MEKCENEVLMHIIACVLQSFKLYEKSPNETLKIQGVPKVQIHRLIYVNTDITANAQTDGLGLSDTCMFI